MIEKVINKIFPKANIGKIKYKRFLNYVIISIFTIIFACISSSLKRGTCILLENIAISILLAVSLGLVVGFLGELSLGHAGFMCVGAYVGGKVALLLQPHISSHFLLLVIALLVGGLTAALFGVIIGLPALRLKGDYLAIVTLAFGEIVRTIFMNMEFFGGTKGLDTYAINYAKDKLFIVAFVLVIFMLIIVQNLIHSKHGRAITAIRDSEIAAKATGINVTQYKIFVFAISSFFAGLAGVIYAFRTNPTYEVFSYNKSIEVLVMVVLGGMGNINGSIISSTLITWLNIKLQTALSGDLAVLKNVFYSLILIIVVIYNNAPALKGFRAKYNFGKLIDKLKKPKNDESAIRNDEGKWDRIPTKIEMNEILSTDLNPIESTVEPGKEDKR